MRATSETKEKRNLSIIIAANREKIHPVKLDRWIHLYVNQEPRAFYSIYLVFVYE